MTTKLLVALVLALVVANGLVLWLWQAERQEHRDSVVRLENERAALDSTRRQQIRVKDREVTVATRLAYQREVELGEALQQAAEAEGLVAHARAELELLEDSLHAVTTGTGAVADETVTASGRLDARDSLGLTIEADVEVTPPTSTWRWAVRRRPLRFDLVLGCQGTAAVAHLTGPTWADFDLRQIDQNPDMCNPLPRMGWNPVALRFPSVLETVLLVGTGLVLGHYLDSPP